jgi:hypothetical protein
MILEHVEQWCEECLPINLAFFDTYVKGLSRAPILDRVPSRFPEVRFRRRLAGGD